MALRVTPRIRTLDTFADPEEALLVSHRIDQAAFGQPPDPARLGSKRQLISLDRAYQAQIDGVACGVATSYESELTLPGGARVPVAAVSDVGVLPTHRRRGVLSALMDAQLADRCRHGDAAAVLHASEGSIYRRFGYGPATRQRGIRIDTARTRFRADAPDPGGSLRLLQPAEALGACWEVQDRVVRRTAGALTRDELWWSVVLGRVESYLGGGPGRLVMVHHDDGGAADGYAIYEVHEDWSAHTASHTLAVWELAAAGPAVEVALWRALVEHDLVAAVTGPIAVDSVLWEVVADPRHVAVRWEQDLLWVRLLDVERVLSQRRYQGSGQLVLDVDDPVSGPEGGRYLLEVDDGVGSCTRIGSDADAGRGAGVGTRAHVMVSMSDLGSLVLGDRSFRRLGRAGRTGSADPAALRLADQLFSVDPLPWCGVRF